MSKFVGISVVAGVSGATGVGVLYFKPWERKETSVKQKLEKLKKTILTSSNDSRWEVKVHVYTNKASTNPDLRIDNKDTITKEELSTWCSTALGETNSEDLYNKAKAWCLAPSVKDKLSKEKKSILTSLTQKLQSYKQHNTDDDKKIPIDQMENKTQSSLNDEDFKKWCDTASDMELLEGKDNNYERIIHWCTT